MMEPKKYAGVSRKKKKEKKRDVVATEKSFMESQNERNAGVITLEEPSAEEKQVLAQMDAKEADRKVPKTSHDMEPLEIVGNIPRKAKAAAPEKVTREVADVVDQVVDKETKEEVVAKQGVDPKKKKGGLSSQFKNALTHLAPQAIGMLVGGLMEGTDGAVAGGEMGRRVTSDLHNYAQQDQQMETANQNAETQRMFAEAQRQRLTQKDKGSKILSKNWVDSSGNPVFTDKDGTFTNLNGEIVTDVKKQAKEISPLQAARMQNYNNIEKNREFKREQANEADAQRTLKDLRSTEEYKSSIKMSTQVPVIRKLITDANIHGGQSLSMLGPKVAKGIAGEVGVLTQEDVKRYVKDPSLVGGMRDTLAKVKSGKLTDVTADNLNRLLDIMDTHAKETIADVTKREATLFSRRSGMSVSEAMYKLDATANAGQKGSSKAESIFSKYKGQ